MVAFPSKAHYDVNDFRRIVEVLRGPGGCPWDQEQTHESLRRGMLEEAYEACGAIDEEDPDPEIQALEEELFVKINSSGLGPMGLGGDTTVLGVKIRKAFCHTASLPVAVNIGCWATRRAVARITDNDVIYSQGVRL